MDWMLEVKEKVELMTALSKIGHGGVPVWLSGNVIWLVSRRMQVQSLALLRGLRIWHCHSHTQLGSGIAVAVVQAGSYNSHLTPSLGASICYGCGPEKKKKKKKIGDRRESLHMGKGYNELSFFFSFIRAASLHHSPSNARSKPHLWPTTACGNTRSLTHWGGQGSNLHPHRLARFLIH